MHTLQLGQPVSPRRETVEQDGVVACSVPQGPGSQQGVMICC